MATGLGYALKVIRENSKTSSNQELIAQRLSVGTSCSKVSEIAFGKLKNKKDQSEQSSSYVEFEKFEIVEDEDGYPTDLRTCTNSFCNVW